MKKQILVMHGGDAFNTYEEYLSSLKNKELSLDRLRSRDWKQNLSDVLGEKYEILAPRMPNAQNARYKEWKIYFEKIIPLLDETIALIGHSLGGIFLAKYLSENHISKQIKATFLVAAPFNSLDNHPFADFIITNNLELLAQQAGELYLYHSRDDMVVPYSNVEFYQRLLPQAHIKSFENRQHFNQSDFPELVYDILNLK